MTYSPWRELRDKHPGVILGFDELDTCAGFYEPDEEVIILDSRLDQTGRRCTLEHELQHRARGHVAQPIPWFHRRYEREADDLAARRLIELPALIDALAWAMSITEAAEALRVTPKLLRLRLQGLTPEEQAAVDEAHDELRDHQRGIA